MLTAAILVGAGRGHRLGGEIPKQYLPLPGGCALRRSVNAFLRNSRVRLLQVVIHPDDRTLYAAALEGVDDPRLLDPTFGGETRAASVLRGLEALEARRPERVLIHDAARPFVPAATIDAVMDALATAPGSFAALPVVDALWSAQDGVACAPVSREGLWRAQTPQGFRFDAILAAHRQYSGDAADDVAVARAFGLAVGIVPGSEANYKITTADDLARARAELGLDAAAADSPASTAPRSGSTLDA